MAPRETRIEAGGYDRMTPAQAERLRESTASSPRPYVAPKSNKPPPPVSNEEPVASVASVSPAQQAATMKSAAETGTPFVEQCRS